MTSRLFRVIGFAVSLVLTAGKVQPAAPASADDLAAQVKKVFAAWDKSDTPGAGVAVIQHGKIVFEQGFGSANLEYGIPIGADTVFHVASISKQFTAMAIVLLERDGKLSIDDEVHKYLPQLPDYGHPITLRHLLNHTSGIRDQWATLALAGWSLQDVIKQSQILRLLYRQKELNFPPGDRMLYSNGGFTLLAEVVRRVSGEPLDEFCKKRIFEPLGMSHTHFHLRLEQVVPNRAYSYSPHGKDFEFAPLNYANMGATSLFTTAGDLARWLDNFREPKVGTAKEIARLVEPGVLNSGKAIDYALGIGVGKYRGLRTFSHGGADAAYRSHVLWFPEQEFGVAIASNHEGFDPAARANEIADIYLATVFPDAKPAPRGGRSPEAEKHETIAFDPGSFDKFVGTYAFVADPGFAITYTRENNRYYAQATGQGRLEIFPETPTKFFFKVIDAQVTFFADADGKVNRIVHHQGGRDNRGTRVKEAAPEEAAKLKALAGNYWSEELETRYTFAVKDGKLVGRHIRHGEFALARAGEDRFRTGQWFMPNVEFLRDAAGAVIGVKLGGGRVTGVTFVRQGAVANKTAAQD